MQLTIRFLVLAILSGSATAKHRLGTYGLTNGGINICKEAGQLHNPGRAINCYFRMEAEHAWNCKICMNACLRYDLGNNESICNRCVEKGCGNDVVTCGSVTQPQCADPGVVSTLPPPYDRLR
ncbi:hypothetical protein IAQ61_003451 [Plenodomus lingam]|uniref:uncharacterized protein n=1 Tax=Leptosphaeria maculans TaxID=5022 RepID=UPI00332C901E|nr:hypothetical protein IAQ61_003451 [Plenodomus lingam]